MEDTTFRLALLWLIPLVASSCHVPSEPSAGILKSKEENNPFLSVNVCSDFTGTPFGSVNVSWMIVFGFELPRRIILSPGTYVSLMVLKVICQEPICNPMAKLFTTLSFPLLITAE